jgi:hypothetical protein
MYALQAWAEQMSWCTGATNTFNLEVCTWTVGWSKAMWLHAGVISFAITYFWGAS